MPIPSVSLVNFSLSLPTSPLALTPPFTDPIPGWSGADMKIGLPSIIIFQNIAEAMKKDSRKVVFLVSCLTSDFLR